MSDSLTESVTRSLNELSWTWWAKRNKMWQASKCQSTSKKKNFLWLQNDLQLLDRQFIIVCSSMCSFRGADTHWQFAEEKHKRRVLSPLSTCSPPSLPTSNNSSNHLSSTPSFPHLVVDERVAQDPRRVWNMFSELWWAFISINLWYDNTIF